MKNTDIQKALNYVGKVISFEEVQDNLQVYKYTGKVLSAIIEHDQNHKLCVEIATDDAHFFDLNRMHTLEVFEIKETIVNDASIC